MAPKTATAPKPALGEKPGDKIMALSPDLQTFAVVKLGRPRTLWRFLNRVIAYANGEISKDEFDLAYETAKKQVDGKALHPEDAAKRVEKMLNAQLDTGDKCSAAVAKCELSNTAILIAFLGRPSAGFFHSQKITLLDPAGLRRG